jgi:hypothetical protein
MIHDKFSLFTLSNDERVTCESIISSNTDSNVTVLPTHHINDFGDFDMFVTVLLLPILCLLFVPCFMAILWCSATLLKM